MNWLYPKVRNIRKILPFVLLGGLLGGVYGVVHDQVSFTISAEYFTEAKFKQFQYADFGLPNRIFAAIIGFLATSWIGLFVGWLLARIRFYVDDHESARQDILRGLATVFSIALFMAFLGGVVGYIRVRHFHHYSFFGWEKEITSSAMPNFAIVGIIHYFSYLGGFAGLGIAIFNLKRKMKRGVPGNIAE